MANHYIARGLCATVLAVWGLFSVAHAQSADPTVDTLDKLERQRLILQKQLEVSKLQEELNKSRQTGGTSQIVPTEDLNTAALSLVKIMGLSSKPTAIFLYNGYRLTAQKDKMVLPTVQVRAINENYVVLKDIQTGKESILWLSVNG